MIREDSLPGLNEDLSEELRRDTTIHYVVHTEEVVAIALQPSSAQTHTGLPIEPDIHQALR